MKQRLIHICKKIYERIKKLYPFIHRPVFWCALASLAICVLTLAITITGHARSAGADPITGIAAGRSFVLDPDIAALYAKASAQQQNSSESGPYVAVVDNERFSGATADSSSTSSQLTGGAASSSPASESSSQSGALSYGDVDLPGFLYQNGHEDTQNTGRVPSHTPSSEPFVVPQPEPSAAVPSEEVVPSEEPPVDPSPEVPPVPPVVSFHFPLGETVSQQVVLLEVQASDQAGTPLLTDSVSVLCNDTPLSPRFVKDNVITYAPGLKEGENIFLISATDSAGTMITYTQTIQYTVPETPVVTVSVEATTTGFGFLVPPTAVPYEEGKSAAYYVNELLTSQGFALKTSGKPEKDFKLHYIEKKDAFARPMLPEDLKTYILADQTLAPLFDDLAYNPDSLGENQFVHNSSGWMFSLNSQYLYSDMSETIPREKDYIRLRYTIANGKDIGNSFDQDNHYTGWDKEW